MGRAPTTEGSCGRWTARAVTAVTERDQRWPSQLTTRTPGATGGLQPQPGTARERLGPPSVEPVQQDRLCQATGLPRWPRGTPAPSQWARASSRSSPAGPPPGSGSTLGAVPSTASPSTARVPRCLTATTIGARRPTDAPSGHGNPARPRLEDSGAAARHWYPPPARSLCLTRLPAARRHLPRCRSGPTIVVAVRALAALS